ncbi:hypothetical protein ACFX13_036341 [Malus domestica]|uniref:S-protein homolog 24-like n=1 Tax=Malus sylvestris TaxID=3752 RepID=UPI0021AC5B5D|nr:S-protein homolog 24-like [Malus sylvestris]
MMRAFLSHTIYLLLAISTFVMSSPSSAAPVGPHSGNYLVQIRNELSGTATILKVHCKSNGGGDLGSHWISSGDRFTVRFHNDKCVLTEYWCKLSWEYSKSKSHGGNYRFFNCDKSFLESCGFQECTWKVKDDGIYLHDLDELQDLKYYHWQT